VAKANVLKRQSAHVNLMQNRETIHVQKKIEKQLLLVKSLMELMTSRQSDDTCSFLRFSSAARGRPSRQAKNF
jgi:hypothetical protein